MPRVRRPTPPNRSAAGAPFSSGGGSGNCSNTAAIPASARSPRSSALRDRRHPAGLRRHVDRQAVTLREFVIEFSRRTDGPMLPTVGVSRTTQQRNGTHEEAVSAATNALGTQSEYAHRRHVQHPALALFSWNPVLENIS